MLFAHLVGFSMYFSWPFIQCQSTLIHMYMYMQLQKFVYLSDQFCIQFAVVWLIIIHVCIYFATHWRICYTHNEPHSSASSFDLRPSLLPSCLPPSLLLTQSIPRFPALIGIQKHVCTCTHHHARQWVLLCRLTVCLQEYNGMYIGLDKSNVPRMFVYKYSQTGCCYKVLQFLSPVVKKMLRSGDNQYIHVEEKQE